MAPPVLSLVLPAYNAARYLGSSLAVLQEHRRRWPASEVLVVDDGSRDDTARVAEEQAGDGIRCLKLPKNVGKGGAVRAGMLAAKGDYRIFMDADVPYELEAVDTMLRYLDFKEFDVTIGSRHVPGSHFDVRLSWPRRLSSLLFTTFVSRMVVGGMVDTQCGIKGFRAAAAERLFSMSVINGFAFDVEILYLAFKLTLDIKRVPVRQVRDEPSTISLSRQSVKMLVDVLRVPARYYRGGYSTK
jgi:dolichyl-phosphate beta-glucosyltransferase